MKDEYKTKVQLINELKELRQRVDKLERIKARHKRSGGALQREHNLLSRIMETSPAGITVVDRQGKIIFANAQAEQVLGLTKDEITQRTYNAPEWRITDYGGNPLPDKELPFRKVMTTGKPVFDVRHAIQWPNGRRVLLSINAAPLFNDSGKFDGMVATVEDITERVQTEKELEESEEKYKKLVEESLQGIVIAQGLPPRFIFVNSVIAEMLGYSTDELMSFSPGEVREIIHPEDQAIFFQRYQDRLEGRQAPSRYEIRGMRKDGTVRWAELMASRIEYQGKPAVHATFVDITERKRAEAQLRESEHLYRTLTENSLTGIYMFREGHYLFANEIYCKMYGYSWDDLKSMDPLNLIAPECREQISERVRKRLAGEDVLSDYETKVIRKDGAIRDVHLKATRIMYEGKPTVLGSVIDITEKKQAEEALGQSEEQYRSLFETSTNAILIRNRDGIITMVNEAALILLGATKAEDLIGKAYLDLVHPEDRALSAERVEKTFLIALGQHEPYEHGTKAISPREHRMVNLNGDIIYVESTAVAFHHKEELFIQGIFRDITGRKRAEAALRESEEKYRSLVANATDAIFIVQDGRIKFPNPITLTLAGYSAEELVTLPFINLIHPEDQAMVLDNYTRRLKGEEVSSTYTFRVINKRGEELWGQLNAVLITWEGRPAILCFIRDITPQKRLEAQYLHAQKMEAVGTLAGGIAHDFNNLLQAVLGYTEILLLDKEKLEHGYQELQEIKRAAQRGGELTQRLLTFSRRVPSKLRPVNLNQEINQIQKLLQRTIPKMIEIELTLADELRTVNADPAQIEQALMNLAVNARDAMPEGGKLIIGTKNITLDEEYCKMHLGAKPGDYVLLTVTDTGHGMDKETLEHLFEPFYTTKGVGRGTGLGLSMVYGIVKSHDGYIFCDSAPGKGATFEIYLPVIEQKLEKEELKEEKISMGGKETILLIDDEESIRDLGNQILNQFGYTVLATSDGESGLELYRKEKGKIDLVILDLIMPGMGGKKCLEELLKMNPKVKVVIASGYSIDGPTEEALEVGAKNFVSKPYAMRQMLKVVREVLDKNA